MSNAAHLPGPQAWLNFRRIICERWAYENLILLGDAAHTAHFSIGSGTKLALEDAIKLAEVLNRPGLARERRARRISGRAATSRCSSSRTAPATRPNGSRRSTATSISSRSSSLIRCSPARSASATRICGCATRPGWRASSAGSSRRRAGAPVNEPAPPMFAPFRLRGLRARQPRRRLADGDVFGRGRRSERLPPRPLRRPRPGRRRPRLYRDDLRLGRGPDHARAAPACTRPSMSRRGGGSSISSTPTPRAKFCLQLGHSGPKGSTKVGWEGYDVPLDERQLAGHGRLGRAVEPGQPGAAADDPRRHGRGASPSSSPRSGWGSRPAST